jgi:hypothetical protein
MVMWVSEVMLDNLTNTESKRCTKKKNLRVRHKKSMELKFMEQKSSLNY